MVTVEMGDAADTTGMEDEQYEQLEEGMERLNLALPDIDADKVAHAGQPRFKELQKQLGAATESDALEKLIIMKSDLRRASGTDFWAILMRGMTGIAGAQCGFVAKRILVDVDPNGALVEQPALGDPGSCLMGTAFYLNGGSAVDDMRYDYRYVAHESPCAHMRHDKVFIIPEKMGDFVRNSPNKLPWDRSESFMGIPLFHDGKCFGHFGMIWSQEGAEARKLSWSFLEMFCHALEDMILMRLLQGKGFAKKDDEVIAKVIPLDAITAGQSLKPYAKSLSHELRTPMQGVVGMLDIMHANVMEAIEHDDGNSSIFDELRANIELVQESSKRAVEAADNVVHAYDLNMEMPETPPSMEDYDSFANDDIAVGEPSSNPTPDVVHSLFEGAAEIIGSSPPSHKRPRGDSLDYQAGPPHKRIPSITENGSGLHEDENDVSALNNGLHSSYCSEYLQAQGVASRDFGSAPIPEQCVANNLSSLVTPIPYAQSPDAYSPIPPPFTTNLGADHRHIAPGLFIRKLVAQAVLDIHPIETAVIEVPGGQETLLKLQSPRGDIEELKVTITIHSNVPERIVTKELNLNWIVMKMVENAFKFTPSGAIDISIRVSSSGQLIDLRVTDTGCGVKREFQDYIFKPHWQEDATISRAKDGLGLSLFNAKAIARKMLKGDVILVRSATEGPQKGSEFMIRFPLMTSPKGSKFQTLLPSGTDPARTLDFSNGQAAPVPACRREGVAPSTNGIRDSEAMTVCEVPKTTIQLRQRNQQLAEHDQQLASKIPLKIMIVEDNPVNRMVLQGYLAKLGYDRKELLNAYDGLEAVAEFEHSTSDEAQNIDLILMDLWMPNMDGYQATESIFRMAEERGLPAPAVIAVTADITSDSLERAKTTGMAGYISKPYKVTELQERITDYFGNKAMEQ